MASIVTVKCRSSNMPLPPERLPYRLASARIGYANRVTQALARICCGFKMHDNPYQPPLESPQYYTDDITTLPLGAIWRFASRQGIVGSLVTFPMFLMR